MFYVHSITVCEMPFEQIKACNMNGEKLQNFEKLFSAFKVIPQCQVPLKCHSMHNNKYGHFINGIATPLHNNIGV